LTSGEDEVGDPLWKVDLWGDEAFETETGQDRLRGTDRPYTASSANNQPVVTILRCPTTNSKEITITKIYPQLMLYIKYPIQIYNIKYLPI
jgi:hypothetical protein